MVFYARTQHESILIECFHVVTGRFCALFLPDTTPPKLRMEILHFVQDDRGTVQDDRGTVQDDRGTVQDNRGIVQDDRGTVQDDRGIVHDDRGLVQDD